MEQVRPWKSCRARGFLNFFAGSIMFWLGRASGDLRVGLGDFGLDHFVDVMLQGLDGIRRWRS
jgi:hypothetical protein